MKFYILDDLVASVKVLENIVESKDLGEVVGTATDPEKAIPEILVKAPDIVLVDLLMPKKDGISVVREIRDQNPDISFIMVSQVADKNMISDAYNAGIEFFITKPNNRIEIEKVIRNVIEKRRMAEALKGIRAVIGDSEGPDSLKPQQPPQDDLAARARRILGSIGMLGESGTKDILKVLEMLDHNGWHYNSKETLNAYAESLESDPKIVKQRIRRAVKKGLTNIASLGVEDYYGDDFNEYARTLFNFDAVRSEMDLLRGRSAYGGSPSIDKFFEGLEMLCEEK
ncbi:MAG: DNA-binding domain-containing protein [Firmicutes bacterium]|nr:DNA-binding domain-containing protein [Bacillota bacterium]MBR3053225.1 DNA-binding domain-containing protein [Bacillota bacterium]